MAIPTGLPPAQDQPRMPPVERWRFQLIPVGSDWLSPVIVVDLASAASPPPFLVVGHSWRAMTPAMIRLRLRVSSDGRTWGAWQPVTIDPDTLEPASAGGMVMIAAGTRYLQYHLVAAADQPLVPIEVDLVNPGATPPVIRDGYRKRMAESAATDPLRQTAMIPRPPVITRTEWGCPDGQGTSRPPVSYTTVTHLIVHHTASDNRSSDWAAVVRAIWNFHFYDRGYIDIGYNYLIDPDGVIYEGRSGGDNVQGAHFSGVNGGTMGVALLGTFTSVAPTAKALESLRRLLAWKSDQRELTTYLATPHAASGRPLAVIAGHRDGPGATECPGEILSGQLPRLRAEVHNLRVGAQYVTVASAASYTTAAAAPDSIVAAFGQELAPGVTTATSLPLPEVLGGVTVRLIDRLQREFVGPLFYVSPAQVNLHLPAGLADGPATILIGKGLDNGPGGAGASAAGSLEIRRSVPALFTANANGAGAPAALVLRVREDQSIVYEPVSRFDTVSGQYLPRTILFGSPAEQLYLVAFGTGMRHLDPMAPPPETAAVLGAIDLAVTFLGPAPGYVGLDQVNLALPRALAGSGELPLELVVDGRRSNQVVLNFGE